jgi:GT2 family glycosyltransferase
MNSQAEISIIIVHYKTPELLANCLQSIVENDPTLRKEIIVVDNHSEDDTQTLIQTKFSDVTWINTGYNAGFARANNLGIHAASSPYILLLNSDTLVQKDTISKCLQRYKELEKKVKLGFLACQLIDFEGNLQFNSRFKTDYLIKIWNAHPIVIFLRRILRVPYDSQASFQALYQLHQQEHFSPWLGGTFLLIRNDTIRQKSMQLDEDFFMYAEDIEWCLRLGDQGYQHVFYPEVHILHAEGGSFTIKEQKRMQIHLSEWLLLIKRHGIFMAKLITAFQQHGLKLEIKLLRRKNKHSEVDRRQPVVRMFSKFRKELFSPKFRSTSGSDRYLKYDA